MCFHYSSIDLIQQKKLDSGSFYESNLMEARFDSLPFYSNNYGMYKSDTIGKHPKDEEFIV